MHWPPLPQNIVMSSPVIKTPAALCARQRIDNEPDLECQITFMVLNAIVTSRLKILYADGPLLGQPHQHRPSDLAISSQKERLSFRVPRSRQNQPSKRNLRLSASGDTMALLELRPQRVSLSHWRGILFCSTPIGKIFSVGIGNPCENCMGTIVLLTSNGSIFTLPFCPITWASRSRF